MTPRPADAWASGAPYENYVGRWSRDVCREFVAWLGVPPGSRWLDVGCGTGALSQTILEQATPVGIDGIDPSQGFIRYACERIGDERVRFHIGDAHELPFEEASFDAAVAGLVLNFLPEPSRAVAEMARVARPGGVVAAYVWDYAGKMQLMRKFWNTAVELDSAALELDEGRRFPIAKPEPLERLFRGAGLGDVAVRAIDIPTVFRDFDDYWSPFLGGQGPAGAYAVSLSDERRAALRDRIRAGLAPAADGSISLAARAWAVQGRKSRGPLCAALDD